MYASLFLNYGGDLLPGCAGSHTALTQNGPQVNKCKAFGINVVQHGQHILEAKDHATSAPQFKVTHTSQHHYLTTVTFPLHDLSTDEVRPWPMPQATLVAVQQFQAQGEFSCTVFTAEVGII